MSQPPPPPPKKNKRLKKRVEEMTDIDDAISQATVGTSLAKTNTDALKYDSVPTSVTTDNIVPGPALNASRRITHKHEVKQTGHVGRDNGRENASDVEMESLIQSPHRVTTANNYDPRRDMLSTSTYPTTLPPAVPISAPAVPIAPHHFSLAVPVPHDTHSGRKVNGTIDRGAVNAVTAIATVVRAEESRGHTLRQETFGREVRSGERQNEEEGEEEEDENKTPAPLPEFIVGPANPIYDLHTLNSKWLYLAVLAHIAQATLLLVILKPSLSTLQFLILIVIAVLVCVCLLLGRYYITKHVHDDSDKAGGSGRSSPRSPNSSQRSPASTHSNTSVSAAAASSTSSYIGTNLIHTPTLFNRTLDTGKGWGGKGGLRLPSEEADDIPARAVYMLALASVMEGVFFAATTAMAVSTDSSGGNGGRWTQNGFYSNSSFMQVLQFVSITFLVFHQIIRPANRCDPLRSMLELEVVAVCWDAVDGATIYELFYDLHEAGHLSTGLSIALRVLLAFWYVSVGCRTGAMCLCHLPAAAKGYRFVLPMPLSIASNPSVDRTLQGLRSRSVIILINGCAELYAMILRCVLWARGWLSELQTEMAIKNIAFLYTVYSAYDMYSTTKLRNWNSTELGCGYHIPSRDSQLTFFRYSFMFCYLIQGILMSLLLSNVTPNSQANRWQTNTGLDIFIVVFFYFYCRHCHVRRRSADKGAFILYPQTSHTIFPRKLAMGMAFVMMFNLFIARVPALYENYENFPTTGFYTYNTALVLVALSILTIGTGAAFWSVSYMLFNAEFTATPGNYNAIHDPTISMVGMTAQIEGAMDVLSTVTLMNLAAENAVGLLGFTPTLNRFIQIFILLELFNAVQCFGFQVFLAGGTDDSPMHLVKWKAIMRLIRGAIDLGVLVLRVILWVRYRALSSVFLIKNLYNILHAITHVERYNGIRAYPKYTLFTEVVPPAEWYGLSKAEWRSATQATIALQAQSGRAV